MPAALVYSDPNSKLRENEISGIRSEREKRTEMYNKAMKYYLGNQRRILERKDGEPDDNVVLNLVQLSADRTVNFIFPAMPKFEIDPDVNDITPEEQWLHDAFEHNGGLSFLQQMVLIGFLGGHLYIRVKPPRKDDINAEFPKFYLLDPTQMITY